MTKTRPDAFLKNLPPEQQALVFAYMRTHSYPKTREMIYKDLADEVTEWEKENDQRLALAKSTLSAFYQWYPLQSKLASAAGMADTVKEVLKELPDLKLSGEQLAEAGQIAFEKAAIEQEDGKLFIALQHVREKRAARMIEREKLDVLICEKYLAWFKDARAREIAESTATNADKIAALRKAFLSDVDAVGKLELPQ